MKRLTAATSLEEPDSVGFIEADTTLENFDRLRRPLAEAPSRTAPRQELNATAGDIGSASYRRDWVVIFAAGTALGQGRRFHDRRPLQRRVFLSAATGNAADFRRPASDTGFGIPEVRQRIARLAADSSDEWFGAGGESLFSTELAALVLRHDVNSLLAIESAIVQRVLDDEAAGEALRTLGALRHPKTKDSRRFLLQRQLRAQAARIRYAAGLGLASMDDPRAIRAIREAIEREPHERLRNHFSEIKRQLEETERCLSS